MLKRCFFSVLIFVTFCSADRIFLINGDIISGKIKTATTRRITINSELMGEVVIDVSKIKTFETDEPIPFNLSDGTVINEKIVAGTEGEISFLSDEEQQNVKIDDIAAINPPEPEKPKWKGSIEGGGFYSSGNTNKDGYNLGFSLGKDRGFDRINFKGESIKTREKADDGKKELTEDWWKIDGKYDYFISEKNYLYGQSGYMTDYSADLDTRVIIGGGFGFSIIDKPDDLTLDTELGLASIYEKYYNESSTQKMSLRLAYKVIKKVNDSIELENGLEYYPQTERFSDYYLQTYGSVKYNLSSNIFARYKISFDYDSTPADDSGSTDLKHVVSFGYEF